MRTVMTTEVKKKAKETKGVNGKVRYLKTITKLDTEFTEETHWTMDILGDMEEDISLLGLQSAPAILTITVTEAIALGRMVNRSISALGRIGLEISALNWDDTFGLVEVKDNGLPLLGNDMPALSEVISRLVVRATGKLGGTQHPLSLYDLKQAIGIIKGMKDGNESDMTLNDWMNVRELAILEGVKEEKAKAKAEAKAEREKAKAKARAEGNKKAEDRRTNIKAEANKAKAKAKTGTKTEDRKTKNAASLTPV